MKTVKRYKNRFVALVLAVMLVVSAFSSVITMVSAAEVTPVLLHSNDSKQLPSGVNLQGKTNISRNIPCHVERFDTIKGASLVVEDKIIDNLNDATYNTNNYMIPTWNNTVRNFATFVDGVATDNSSNGNGTVYVDMYYDLKDMVKLDYLVLSNHPTPELITGHYELYVGTCIDDIFNPENKIATVDNREAFKRGEYNHITVVDFKGYEGRVIAMRILDPISTHNQADAITQSVIDKKILEVTDDKSNNIYPRICEFAVYGDYVDPNFDPEYRNGYIPFKDVKVENLRKDYGTSLLTKNNIISAVNGSTAFSNSELNNLKTIVDNSYNLKAEMHKDFEKITAANKVDISFAINPGDEEIMRVDGFAFRGMAPDRLGYAISHYQVFVAEELGDLYLDENMAYEYHAVTDGSEKTSTKFDGSPYDYIDLGQLVEFNESKLGNYFGIRILNPVYNVGLYGYGRLSFIYAWGKGATIEPYETNVASNMPIDAYFTEQSGKKKAVTNTNLTPEELRSFTDENEDTSGVIDTTGTNRDTLTIIYNLCANVDINGLDILSTFSDTKGFNEVAIYASKNLAGINDEDNLKFSAFTADKSGKSLITKTFAKTFNARYVRFVFKGTKEDVEINEIRIKGKSTQATNKPKDLTVTLDKDSLLIYKTNIKTGSSILQTEIPEKRIKNMIDTLDNTFCPLLWGVVDKHKYDIILNLGDLRTVNKMKINFVENAYEYWPTKVNVYIGETIGEANSEKSKPAYVIDYEEILDGNGLAEIYVRPTLGRYIRFELADFAKNERYIDSDGKQMIATAIAEIKVDGTAVKGTQTDPQNDVLQSFTVKKHKMKVAVMRLDINDIFADLADVRITAQDATKEQLWSLYNIPYMQIFNKKVYKIEFIDIYGNVIKDINDRSVQVYFEIPKGYKNGLSSIGDASDKTTIGLIESSENKKYCYTSINWSATSDNKVAYCGVVTDTDPYWDTLPGEPPSEDDYYDDEEWDDGSIHTTDEKFIVSPFGCSDFLTGTKFTAKDISQTASDDDYMAVLKVAEGKKVAAFFDMKLEYNGSDLELDGAVSITYQLPSYITDNFTDLEVVYLDDNNEPLFLYSEAYDTELIFETEAMGKFIVIGTALDGSSSIDDGSN